VVKVRRHQKRGDYTDPGWFKHPPGTVAYEWTGDVPNAQRPRVSAEETTNVEMSVRKPAGHGGHH